MTPGDNPCHDTDRRRQPHGGSCTTAGDGEWEESTTSLSKATEQNHQQHRANTDLQRKKTAEAGLGKDEAAMVWYCSYGSNLSRARFMTYIVGGWCKPLLCYGMAIHQQGGSGVVQVEQWVRGWCTRAAATKHHPRLIGPSSFRLH